MPLDYDVIIIGGGMVGASLAVALSSGEQEKCCRIAIVEAFPHQADDQPSFDAKAIALSYGSKMIFDGLGLWPAMQSQAEPITFIHVSDRGHFGASRLTAAEEGVEALGYVIEARRIGQALFDAIQALDNVDVLCPARFKSMTQHDDYAAVTVTIGDRMDHSTNNSDQTLSAQIVIAADGVNSPVRAALGLGETRKDYAQSAIITTVRTNHAKQGAAYERFTDTGPLAFLPLVDDRYAVVWTVDADKVDEIIALDDAAFIDCLQHRFGHRLGAITRLGKRVAFPLQQMVAKEMVSQRAVLMGNAAHSFHPVAGQGLNLSLRDVAVLSESLHEAFVQGEDLGSVGLLARYIALRKKDHQAVTRFSNVLVDLFSSHWPPVAHLRAAGLLAVDMIAPARHALAQQSMGVKGRLTRLARGLSL